MAKLKKAAKRPPVALKSKVTPTSVVGRKSVDKVVVSPNKVSTVAVITAEEQRKSQILISYFKDIDYDTLEGDMDVMNELQIIVNRRGDDEASAAIGRVIELLETLQDTGETCGFNSGK